MNSANPDGDQRLVGQTEPGLMPMIASLSPTPSAEAAHRRPFAAALTGRSRARAQSSGATPKAGARKDCAPRRDGRIARGALMEEKPALAFAKADPVRNLRQISRKALRKDLCGVKATVKPLFL